MKIFPAIKVVHLREKTNIFPAIKMVNLREKN